jgi:hypothetical protein
VIHFSQEHLAIGFGIGYLPSPARFSCQSFLLHHFLSDDGVIGWLVSEFIHACYGQFGLYYRDYEYED